VIDEAAQMADEIGLSHLTLAAPADRLGVRYPSLYKHVDGMDGLPSCGVGRQPANGRAGHPRGQGRLPGLKASQRPFVRTEGGDICVYVI
jgi:hypothetical protein